MRATIASLALAAAGCVSTSEIVPAGKDSYMVTGASHGGASGGKEGAAALKAANAYCEKMGKHLQMRRTDTGYSLNYASMNLVFSCLDANDPEYKRPELAPANDALRPK
jgi:hypothetical protein